MRLEFKDDYTNVSPMDMDEDWKLAKSIFDDYAGDDGAFEAGRRNDDAVDLCIALHVLGERDVIGTIKDAMRDGGADQEDRILAMDHVRRVAPYLDGWGPEGSEYRALLYTINY